MEALRILIVEDDLLLATELEEQLLDFGYVILDNVANYKDAIQSYKRRLPDLVLCDIQLEGSKKDGIEVAHEFNSISKVPIIFLTAFGDAGTVERAKKVKPAYYLVKPCNPTQLKIAMDFAISNFSKKKEADPRHSLQIQPSPSENLYVNADYFFIRTGDKYNRLQLSDILWVEALGSNVKIITDKNNYILSANLSSFFRKIPNEKLLRVHRSFAINLNKVNSFNSGSVFIFYKNLEHEIPIGKTYREQVQNLFPKLFSD